MHTGPAWKKLYAQWRIYRAPLGFSIRVMVAAISALLIAQFFALPLHGLWVVLTATVVTQLSIGGSLRAGLEYVLGTLGGALYAGVVGVLVAPTGVVAQIGVLAITIAPLAFAAALNPNFRVAPFSAVLVLLISGQLGEGPIESAFTRLLEVTLGGAVAVIVSFLVFPERAHRLAREAAARVLDEMAKDIPDILAGFFQRADATELVRIQDRIGSTVSELQGVDEEFKRERPLGFTSAPDPAPLPRTLLRLVISVGGSRAGTDRYFGGFLQGMRELGYIEGRDYGLEVRYADGQYDHIPAQMDELVRLKPDIIVSGTMAGVLAAKKLTNTIPIVSETLIDPIGFGVAASQARPGGNVTGVMLTVEDLPTKLLGLALEVVSGANRVGLLV